MNVWVAGAIVALAVAIAVGALLLVRRWSPHGGHFGDTSRAAGVFSILATSFAVLLAFVIFLAASAYGDTTTGAEDEARTVSLQFETAQLLPPESAPAFSSELTCYARSVIHQEWPQTIAGDPPTLNAWGVPLFVTLKATNPTTPTEQAAYSQWLSQTADRQQARQERIHGANGVIPAPLWFILLISAAIVLGFVFFFADRGEGAVVQAVQVGAVTAMLVSSLLVVRFLDNPYQRGAGSIRPVAMEQTLTQIESASTALHLDLPTLCDENGQKL